MNTTRKSAAAATHTHKLFWMRVSDFIREGLRTRSPKLDEDLLRAAGIHAAMRIGVGEAAAICACERLCVSEHALKVLAPLASSAVDLVIEGAEDCIAQRIENDA